MNRSRRSARPSRLTLALSPTVFADPPADKGRRARARAGGSVDEHAKGDTDSYHDDRYDDKNKDASNHGQVVSECNHRANERNLKGQDRKEWTEWCEERGSRHNYDYKRYSTDRNCYQKADNKGLSGDKRRKFINDCLDSRTGTEVGPVRGDLQDIHARERASTAERAGRAQVRARARAFVSCRTARQWAGGPAPRLGDGLRGHQAGVRAVVPAARPSLPQRRARTRQSHQRKPGALHLAGTQAWRCRSCRVSSCTRRAPAERAARASTMVRAWQSSANSSRRHITNVGMRTGRRFGYCVRTSPLMDPPMRHSSLRILVLVAPVLAMALTACGQSQSPSATEPATVAQTNLAGRCSGAVSGGCSAGRRRGQGGRTGSEGAGTHRARGCAEAEGNRGRAREA